MTTTTTATTKRLLLPRASSRPRYGRALRRCRNWRPESRRRRRRRVVRRRPPPSSTRRPCRIPSLPFIERRHRRQRPRRPTTTSTSSRRLRPRLHRLRRRQRGECPPLRIVLRVPPIRRRRPLRIVLPILARRRTTTAGRIRPAPWRRGKLLMLLSLLLRIIQGEATNGEC